MDRRLAKRHFERVAGRYESLRLTDDEPVLRIGERLADRPLVALDVGAGTGRYTLRLIEIVPPGSTVIAVDPSRAMLAGFARDRLRCVHIVQAAAEQLPLASASIELATVFNAVHHFDLDRFVEECCRVLGDGADLFVYTRTPAMNATSIWGRCFPEFAARETRLHGEPELRDAFGRVGEVLTTSFRLPRRATPARLAQQVRGRHYSTFALYDDEELTAALDEFLDTLADLDEVCWEDRNLLVHVRVAT